MIRTLIKKLDGTQLDHGDFLSEQSSLLWFQPFINSGVYGEPLGFTIEHIEIIQSEDELRQAKIARGAIDRAKCQNVLDLIAGYNRDRALTIPQITQMQQTFAQAEGLLRASRPDFAKQVIEAIQPDGVLVTEQMKADCLALLGE